MEQTPPKILLVIDYDGDHTVLFGRCRLKNGQRIQVEQTRWKYIHVEASSAGGCFVHIMPSVYPDEPLKSAWMEPRTVKPDFVLIRNFPLDSHTDTFKAQVMGLLFADLPSVNSLRSVLYSMDRAVQYAELLKAQKALPKEKTFGLVPMYYFSNEKIRLSVPSSPLDKANMPKYPMVLKVGNGHAGRGKVKLDDTTDWRDVVGCLALDKQYFTVEPFCEVVNEYRVQKIGNRYTCFRRRCAGSWKANMTCGQGDLEFEDAPFEEKHKLWIDECAKMFGGLDICGLDVLSLKDGSDVIIEINDTAIGLADLHYEEDRVALRDLVLERMNQLFCPGL